jgi:hypothetical protein
MRTPLVATVCLLFVPRLPAQADVSANRQEPRQSTEIVVPGVRKLTIGGQYRLRYENRIDFDFDSSRSSAGDIDFFSQRARFHVGIDFGDELGAFLQVQDAREWGEESDTFDDDANGLDMHQAYLDVRRMPLLGGAARVGRQEISLGDQRLVGAVDWRTQARSFDGLLQTWEAGEATRVHGIAVQLRETLDGVDDDQWLFGFYGTGSLDDSRKATGDVYLLLLHDDGVAAGSTQNRFTLGGRLVHDAGSWEVGAELATQFGDQAGADIPIAETYAAHVHALWRCDPETKDGLHAWLRAELNLASGNDPATGDNERFNNLFPSAHAHWGMMDLALWENLFNPMLALGCQPTERGELTASWNFFRSIEETDRFGGPNGTLSAGGAGFSRSLGHEADFVYTHRLSVGKDVRSAVQFGYGMFLPGAGVADANAGNDDMAHFVYAQLNVAF